MKRLLVLCLSLTACALEAEPEAYDAAVVSAELTTPPIVCNRNRVSSVSPSSVGLSDFTPDNQWASRSYGSSNLAAVKMYVSLGPSSPVSENSATQLHIQSTAPGCYFAELYAVSYCKNAWGSLPQEIREAGRWYGPNDGVFKSILRCPTWENGDPSSYAPSSQAFMQVKIFAYAPKL